MSSRASGGALAASLITAAIIGFAGGAYFGTQSGGDEAGDGSTPSNSASTPAGQNPPEGGAADGGAPEETEAASGLQLSSAVTAVESNGRIDLSGSITPPTPDVELQLQRSIDGGEWENFDVSMTTKADGEFSGWIQSRRTGRNSLRVVRADDNTVMSNVVDVTIG